MKGGAVLVVNGAKLVADPSGALFWPERELVVVADLHLEKGSSLARRGAMLPPYDTRATLAKLERVLERLAPRRVVSLGDGFHDPDAAARLGADDARRLRALVDAHDWLWVRGNHDPGPPGGIGGRCEAEVEVGGLVLRHAPAAGAMERPEAGGEIAGHFHPKATLRVRGRRLSRRCFATDGRRLLLPAFGSYAGGLNVLDPVVRALFGKAFWVYVLGERRVHCLTHDRLEPTAVQLALDWYAGSRPKTPPTAE